MNWIEANRHHFEKEVYFPPAVEVEVTDVRYAGLVEQCFNRNNMFVSDYFEPACNGIVLLFSSRCACRSD